MRSSSTEVDTMTSTSSVRSTHSGKRSLHLRHLLLPEIHCAGRLYLPLCCPPLGWPLLLLPLTLPLATAAAAAAAATAAAAAAAVLGVWVVVLCSCCCCLPCCPSCPCWGLGWAVHTTGQCALGVRMHASKHASGCAHLRCSSSACVGRGAPLRTEGAWSQARQWWDGLAEGAGRRWQTACAAPGPACVPCGCAPPGRPSSAAAAGMWPPPAAAAAAAPAAAAAAVSDARRWSHAPEWCASADSWAQRTTCTSPAWPTLLSLARLHPRTPAPARAGPLPSYPATHLPMPSSCTSNSHCWTPGLPSML